MPGNNERFKRLTPEVLGKLFAEQQKLKGKILRIGNKLIVSGDVELVFRVDGIVREYDDEQKHQDDPPQIKAICEAAKEYFLDPGVVKPIDPQSDDYPR